MSIKRKVVKALGAILVTSGIFVVIGTAGSSDLGRLTLTEIIIQSIIGIVLLALGYFVIRLATGGGVFND